MLTVLAIKADVPAQVIEDWALRSLDIVGKSTPMPF